MRNLRLLTRNLILAGLLLAGSLLILLLSRQEKDPALSLKINEVCLYNTGSFSGASATFEDYIELYNPTDQVVSLENISLTEGFGNEEEFLLSGFSMEPGEYKIIYAFGPDGVLPEGEAGFSYALSADETVRLQYRRISADGAVTFLPLDSVVVPALELGTSYSRREDGTGPFAQMHPSPGLSNSTSGLLLEVPTFSMESGFYENELSLELFAQEGHSIYYTLDGSLPTQDSLLYTEPLLLSDPSSQENLYAAREDIAAVSDHYVVPDSPVDKAVVIRAAAYDAEGNFSPAVTATYFLGLEEKEAYKDVAVLSLVTDPDNFFADDKGIYIRGDLYEDALDHGKILPEFPWIELMDYMNYYMEGKGAERNVSLTFFDKEHQLSFQQRSGLRIRGNESRSFPQKSFTLFARKRYGTETLPSTFEGSSLSYPDLILNNSKRLKKIFFFSLVDDRSAATQKYTPCQIFLNGEYWGLYYIMEKYSAEYLAGTYGVDAENTLLIKATREVQDGGDENIILFRELRDFLEQDMSDPTRYAQLLEKMDMQSFIDWMCTNIYICNTDTKPLGGNVFTWRVLTPGDGTYEDGRWRWMLYDVDDSLGVGIDNGTPAYEIDSFVDHAGYAPCGFLDDKPMPSLMGNADFRKQFVLTFLDMANENFKAERVSALLDEMEEQYTPWADKSYERWNTNPQDNTFAEQVDEIREFFNHRFDYIVGYLANHFGLTGELATLTLSAEHAGKGTVTLNTITPDLTEDWTGRYYTDYPLTLTAKAEDNAAFLGWEIQGGSIVEGSADSETIQVQLNGTDVSIRAIFE